MSSKGKSPVATDDGPALVPKLRFPEFQGSVYWHLVPMEAVYTFRGNNPLSRDKLNYSTGSVKNIHYGDIHTKFSTHFDITKEKIPFINETELENIKHSSFCGEGDLLLADASEDLADIGKCIEIINLNGEKVVSGLHTILARPIRKQIALGFGAYLFQSGSVRRQIQREAQGAKVLGISPRRLQGLRLTLPPALVEQQKIVDCLTSLDALTAAQERKVKALRIHKKGLMQQLFPQEGETQPRLRFPEFRDAGEWEMRKIGNICDIQRGKFSHRPRNDPAFFGGKYPFIQTGDVVKSAGGTVVGSQSLNEKGLSVSKLFKPTIVLITIAANIGDTGLLKTAACFTDSVVGLITQRDIIAVFLELIMRGKKEYLNKVATTGAQKNINNEILREVDVLLPSVAEQQRIADCLTSLDDLITAESEKLDTLQTHKKGLMQQLFPRGGEDEA